MLVANSFDLWRKDTFFSAAEEVQQSADIMESAYRTWLRARKEGLLPQYLEELARELQMALGTAKWQLEEFEKAVRVSYRNNGDDITITRHKQFVSAIEGQISRAEKALKESFDAEGKKPFRWVNLDEEECDDLAVFLSGSPEKSQRSKDEAVTSSTDDTEVSFQMQILNHGKSLEIVASSENENCFVKQDDSQFVVRGDEFSYNADRNQWRQLEIIIDSNDRQKNALIEETPKEKGSKPSFWRSRGDDNLGARGVLGRTQLRMVSWMNQHMRGHRSQRQQISPVLPANSMRYVLGLMLTIFLVVPFLLYST